MASHAAADGAANDIVVEMAHEVLPVVTNTPLDVFVTGVDGQVWTNYWTARAGAARSCPTTVARRGLRRRIRSAATPVERSRLWLDR